MLVGEPSPLVDENNNPIEPEELTKTYHPVVTSEEFLHGAGEISWLWDLNFGCVL